MNPSLHIEADWSLQGIMSDLGLPYASSRFHRIGFEIDEAGIQKLADCYPDRIFRARQWSDDGTLSWNTLLLRFEENSFLVALGDGRNFAEIIAPEAAQASALHEEVRRTLLGDARTKRCSFYMLRFDCGDFSADPIENLPEAVTDDFLQLCCGEDILRWIERFAERTLARAGGLTIFDGPPGTGKTSLITQMIRRLESTHVFYVLPVSQDSALSSPEMVPFWQKQSARHAGRLKVIVLEDAERLLWKRGGDNREAVSSLLNIADGLMGRMLRLHVICSVNARMQDLDPAILRPGRLMNHRRFDALDREAAERLAAARGLSLQPGEEAERHTLAEVLNPGAWEPPQPRGRIGFGVPN